MGVVGDEEPSSPGIYNPLETYCCLLENTSDLSFHGDTDLVVAENGEESISRRLEIPDCERKGVRPDRCVESCIDESVGEGVQRRPSKLSAPLELGMVWVGRLVDSLENVVGNGKADYHNSLFGIE